MLEYIFKLVLRERVFSISERLEKIGNTFEDILALLQVFQLYSVDFDLIPHDSQDQSEVQFLGQEVNVLKRLHKPIFL